MGGLGARSLNIELQKALNPLGEIRIERFAWTFCLGDKVMSLSSPLEGDGFELPVREHRAMAPSHGFAAASHREASLRAALASYGKTAFRGAAGFRETRRHAVHQSRNAMCSTAVQAARYRAARRAAMRSAHCGNPAGRNVTLQYLSHDGRPAPRRASRRHRSVPDFTTLIVPIDNLWWPVPITV
jgi:hypothetical protein